ncbi:hypothetical protein ACS0TY_026408 [Phlomoides rotata]
MSWKSNSAHLNFKFSSASTNPHPPLLSTLIFDAPLVRPIDWPRKIVFHRGATSIEASQPPTKQSWKKRRSVSTAVVGGGDLRRRFEGDDWAEDDEEIQGDGEEISRQRMI